MNPVLNAIDSELVALSNAITSAMPDARALSIIHGNWQFPSISREDLVAQVTSIRSLIQTKEVVLSENQTTRLSTYQAKLAFLRSNTIPNIWGSSQAAVPAFTATLSALKMALEEVLPNEPDKDEIAAATLSLKRVQQRLRALESNLLAIEPRTAGLAEMVSRIEQAHAAADELPADLADLAEKRKLIEKLLTTSSIDVEKISASLKQAIKSDSEFATSLKNANDVLNRCEAAYRASSSVGLAAAFDERSKALGTAMFFWILGLIAALGAGGYFGSMRLNEMSELLKSSTLLSGGFALSFLMALFSVGGPIWFAWVATKQIGQRFRLAEDYAFKASISRAYEGYRKEAARIDKDLEVRLLRSALDRLDEQPLRLVETETHGSPWHEFLSSDLIKDAVKSVPGFAASMKEAAKDALSVFPGSKSSANTAPVAAIPLAQEQKP